MSTTDTFEVNHTTTGTNAIPAWTPSHVAYHIQETKSGRPIWTRIGSAWKHADQGGYTVQLSGVVPMNGRITLRVPSPRGV